MMAFFTRILNPEPVLPRERQLFSDRALHAMILPLMIEQLLQLIVGIADTMMVSYAGEATVSGVSLDTMIYTIFIYLFTAVATGGAVVVSQYIGSRNRERAELAASQIYLIAGVVSFVCMLLALVLGRPVLNLLYPHVEQEVMSACVVYLQIVTLSFPANALYNAGAAIYRSMGRTRVTMYVSIAMNLLNVIGNAIGIFVLRAGAAGVAWPTTLSWYFAAIVMTVLCMNPKSQVTLDLQKTVHPNGEMIRRILHVALPNAVENTLFQAAKVFLGALIATFGTSQIAANGIGQTLWSLAACMCMSMGPACITVVGQCIGANDPDAAKWYLKKLTRLLLILAFVWNGMILLLVPFILPLYSITEETRRLIWIIVIIHNAFAATIQPFASTYSCGLRAAGDVRYTMCSALFATVVCRTALSFLFGLRFHMGVVGIALAMGMDWCIKSLLDSMRWRSEKWRKLKVI